MRNKLAIFVVAAATLACLDPGARTGSKVRSTSRRGQRRRTRGPTTRAGRPVAASAGRTPGPDRHLEWLRRRRQRRGRAQHAALGGESGRRSPSEQGAEDFEARCLPGGPPRAAPYHTSLFATPKLVLMLFEGNTHMYRQFFVDGSTHPKDLKPTFYGDSRAHWEGDTLVVDTVSFFEKSWYDFAGHSPHQADAPDGNVPPAATTETWT